MVGSALMRLLREGGRPRAHPGEPPAAAVVPHLARHPAVQGAEAVHDAVLEGRPRVWEGPVDADRITLGGR